MTKTAEHAGEKAAGPPGWQLIGLALIGVAVLMRINNALRFKTRLGFDAVENVQYIERLMGSWSLPAPDAAWATSHPPLFYYMGAAMGRVLALSSNEQLLVQALPLLGALLGIITALLAAWWVRREGVEHAPRPVIVLGLLLFLPVNVYMSAMVSEEMLAALLTSLTLVVGMLAAEKLDSDDAGVRLGALPVAAVTGLLAGLALLTKLSAVLVIGAVAGTWLVAGVRRARLADALRAATLFGLVSALIGGWFYAHNLLVYGYLYPQDLSVHALMFEMPPGARGLLDYVYFPLSTFANPQLLDPDLLHSVWGSTYATLYFDGHRHFLSHSVAVLRMGGVLLALGLLPCTAFGIGLLRGVRRALARPGGPDTAMTLLVVSTLAGYVAFTYGNPWFATLKSSYLLGLSIPFAYYASEVLAEWGARSRGFAVWGMLALLLVLVTVTFTFGPVFMKIDGAGLPWQTLSAPR